MRNEPWPSKCSRRACWFGCLRESIEAAAKRGNETAALLIDAPAPTDCRARNGKK